MKALCLWPRNRAYYHRNTWAGKKRLENGSWVLDSPASNAMAHFLHNLFFLAGPDFASSVGLKSVTAELYRANSIQNFDTVACRIWAQNDIEILFYASHAVPTDKGPLFTLEFDEATVYFGNGFDEIVSVDHHNKEKYYGSPEKDHQFRKLFEAVSAVHHPLEVSCTPEAARSHVLCVNGLHESVPDIVVFPAPLIEHDSNQDLTWVSQLQEILVDCYHCAALPAEKNITWARSGREIDLRRYLSFPEDQSLV
jgi:hypothetical protein